MTVEERFFAKVAPAEVSECWIWQACRTPAGYGRFVVKGRFFVAHRFAYELLRDDIPIGLELDHLCRVRACVNPWHLEPVTHKVNGQRGDHWESRKTHCKHGHPYDVANSYYTRNGHRECRACRRNANQRNAAAIREYARAWRAERRASQTTPTTPIAQQPADATVTTAA